MSGGNCPETPRQKMIGMMYLVLTALLALNVSKDILNAFVIVNDGLVKTNNNFEAKNGVLYNAFDRARLENPAKVGVYYDKAMLAKKYSADLIKDINLLKAKVIAYTEYGDSTLTETPDPIEFEEFNEKGVAELKSEKFKLDRMPLEHVSAKDNYDVPWIILGGFTEDGRNGAAMQLKAKIDTYKKKMLALLDPESAKMMKLGLNTDDAYNSHLGITANWAVNTFYHTVLAADVVILNKVIAEIMNAESDVVSKLMESISASDFKFDKIVAKVIPKSNYVLQGTNYEADIFVAAYSSTQNPDVFLATGSMDTVRTEGELGGGKVKLDSTINGMARYSVRAGAIGEQKYRGVIKLKKPNTTDQYNYYPFVSSYTVAKPTAIVAATKMNVLYIGVDNPVEVSVPGIPSSKVTPSVSGATVKKGTKEGEFILQPSPGVSKAMVTAMAEIDGKKQSMGGQEFRVKRVPDPVPYIGGVTGGPIAQAALLAGGSVIPKMENFDFELYFVVNSFTFSAVVNGDIQEFKSNNNQLTPEMLKVIRSLRRGQKVYIEDIKATGAGSQRKLPSINLRIN